MTLRHTLPITVVFALALHLAGCDRPAPSPATGEPFQPADTATAETTPGSGPPPLLVPALPPPGTPPINPAPAGPPLPLALGKHLQPESVLSLWAAAIERSDWAAVRSLWGNHGTDSGLAAPAFSARWATLRRPHVIIGPGQQEGAAGSLYYTAPVSITDGARTIAGEITLRRVNDVPGASAEQLRWHIDPGADLSWLQP